MLKVLAHLRLHHLICLILPSLGNPRLPCFFRPFLMKRKCVADGSTQKHRWVYWEKHIRLVDLLLSLRRWKQIHIFLGRTFIARIRIHLNLSSLIWIWTSIRTYDFSCLLEAWFFCPMTVFLQEKNPFVFWKQRSSISVLVYTHRLYPRTKDYHNENCNQKCPSRIASSSENIFQCTTS